MPINPQHHLHGVRHNIAVGHHCDRWYVIGSRDQLPLLVSNFLVTSPVNDLPSSSAEVLVDTWRVTYRQWAQSNGTGPNNPGRSTADRLTQSTQVATANSAELRTHK